MTPCEIAITRLDDWLDGALTNEQQAELDAHLAACDACARGFAQQRRLHNDLRALGGLANKLADAPPSQTQARSRAWVRMARVAAVLALAVGLAWLAARTWQTRSHTLPPRDTIARRPAARPPTTAPDRANVPESSAVQIVLLDRTDRLARPMPSSNSRIHIVWLYETESPAGIDPGARNTSPGAGP